MEPVIEPKTVEKTHSKAADTFVKTSEMKTGTAKPVIAKTSLDLGKVKLITKDELNKKMMAKEAIQIVNVLNPDKYKLGFIKGSKKIPLDKIDTRMNELDKTRLVVTYCAGRECDASKTAAQKLMAHGFNVCAYEGGIQEWKEAGLAVD